MESDQLQSRGIWKVCQTALKYFLKSVWVCVCVCCRGQHTQPSANLYRQMGVVRLLHCEIFKIQCECFSAKQDCCVASFILSFRGFVFFLFFSRENSYVSGAFFSSCDRFHSNFKSPRDLHFGSVLDWRSDCCRIERKQLIFLFYFFIFILHLLTHSYCLDVTQSCGPQYSQLCTQCSTFNLVRGGFALPIELIIQVGANMNVL